MGFIVKAVKSVVKAVVGVASKIVSTIAGPIVGLFKPKKAAKASSNLRLNKSLEPEASRKIVFGSTASGLDLRFWQVWGAKGTNYDEVLALATHRINAVKELYFEDELAINAAGVVQQAWAGVVAREYRRSITGEAGMYAGGGGLWNPVSSPFTGVAHMKLAWVPTDAKLPNGVPSRYTQIIEGAPLYDPRRDSTVLGGSGSHRINNQDTWEYAPLDSFGQPIGRNNALQVLWYLIGWRIKNPQSGELMLVAGRGVDASDINLSSFIQAANDAEIAGFYTDGIYSTEDTHTSNEDKLTSGGLIGQLIDTGGLWSYHANVNDTAQIALELTDSDVISGGNITWNEYRPISEQYQQVQGKFIDPSPNALFQLNGYPAVRDVNYETLTGLKRRKTQDFENIQDVMLAQKLARLLLNMGQYQAEFAAPFMYRALKAQAWSVVRYTSERFGWVKLFRVYRHDIAPNGIEMLLREIHPSIWAAGSVTQPIAPSAGVKYDPRQEIPVTGLNVLLTTVKAEGLNGNIADALLVSWAIPPGNVRRTEARYRVIGNTSWETGAPVQGAETSVVLAPVMKLTRYEVQARHISVHEVPGPWIGVAGYVTSGAAGNVNYQGILESGVTAQWPYVGNPLGTRPEDNATVGAPTGTNVAGVPAGTLVGNVAQTSGELSRQIVKLDDLISDFNDLVESGGNDGGASGSASAAAASAAAAATARDEAAAARNAAQTAQNDAIAKANAAKVSADGAAGSASTASGQATIATQKADAAGTSASTATAKADIATTKAGEAVTSASNAATSATNADGSKQAAASQAGLAAGSANNALGYSQASANSASSAAGSQSAAATSASAANTSAVNAGTKAGEASVSAGQAAVSSANAIGASNTAATFSKLAVDSRNAAAIRSINIKSDFSDGTLGVWTVEVQNESRALNPRDYNQTIPPKGGFVFLSRGTRDALETGNYVVANWSGRTVRATAVASCEYSQFGSSFGFFGRNAQGAVLQFGAIAGPVAGAPGYYTVSGDIPIGAGIVDIIPWIQNNAPHGNLSAEVRVESFILRDVTEVLLAAASASASNASASTASQKADAAGQSASAANSAKLAAEAANGNAQTSAQNASSSQAVATAQAAIATSQALLAASIGFGSMNVNGDFSDWPDGASLPLRWGFWNRIINPIRVAGTVGRYAVYWNNGGQEDFGMSEYWGDSPGLRNVTPGQYYVMTVEVTLVDGQFGNSGAHVNFYNSNGGLTGGSGGQIDFEYDKDASGSPPSLGIPGRRYRYTKLIKDTSPDTANIWLYAMPRWGGFSSPRRNAVLEYHYVGIRRATSEEIASAVALPSLIASAATNSAAVVTLQQRALAYWQTVANAGTANAFIEARAESSYGAGATSTVAIGAREVHIYNELAPALYTKALSIAAGNVVIYGNLTAQGGIFLGNGSLWRVQYASRFFTVSDGSSITYGTNLGNIPQLNFQTEGLAPLAAGETYKLTADSATSTGAIARLRIITPGQAVRQIINGDYAGNGGPTRQITTQGKPLSANNQYTLNAQGRYTGFVTREDSLSQWMLYGDLILGVYGLRGGVWTRIGDWYIGIEQSYGSAGNKTFTWAKQNTFTFGPNIEAFGITLEDRGNGGTPTDVQAITQVDWTSVSSSGDRSATPNGQTSTVQVIPQ